MRDWLIAYNFAMQLKALKFRNPIQDEAPTLFRPPGDLLGRPSTQCPLRPPRRRTCRRST